ncbi:hypothetical protein CH063_03845 [Colletotrichum higginsianum]|uniref:Uncharacterized protein n=1 Tax=Colletotrichum higginsianum (strain IMI 349063) TaxID=759273 RepID=H1W1H4_COLHI|nr:hypothetical protein CH063_03845 [Colletotrichum higginsianum]
MHYPYTYMPKLLLSGKSRLIPPDSAQCKRQDFQKLWKQSQTPLAHRDRGWSVVVL